MDKGLTVKNDHKDGDQVLSRRQSRRFALQVLFCNDFLKEDIDKLTIRVAESLEYDIDDFLSKPIDIRELAARVQAAGRISSLQNSLLDAALPPAAANVVVSGDVAAGLEPGVKQFEVLFDVFVEVIAIDIHPVEVIVVEIGGRIRV